MKPTDLPVVLRHLRKSIKSWRVPVVTKISRQGNPFMVLVSCLLSLRTRDEITEAASKRPVSYTHLTLPTNREV